MNGLPFADGKYGFPIRRNVETVAAVGFRTTLRWFPIRRADGSRAKKNREETSMAAAIRRFDGSEGPFCRREKVSGQNEGSRT